MTTLIAIPEVETDFRLTDNHEGGSHLLLMGGERGGKTVALQEQLRLAWSRGKMLWVIGRYQEHDRLAVLAGDEGKLVSLTPEQVSRLARQGAELDEPTSHPEQRRAAFEVLKEVAGEFYPRVTVFNLPWVDADDELSLAIDTLLSAAWHIWQEKQSRREAEMVLALDTLFYPLRTKMARHTVMWGAGEDIALWLVVLPYYMDPLSPFLAFSGTLALFQLPNHATYWASFPELARIVGISEEDDQLLSTAPVGTAWVRRFHDKDRPVRWYRASL